MRGKARQGNTLSHLIIPMWRSENNFWGLVALLSYGAQGLNSQCQAWWQVPLPTELSHWSVTTSFLETWLLTEPIAHQAGQSDYWILLSSESRGSSWLRSSLSTGMHLWPTEHTFKKMKSKTWVPGIWTQISVLAWPALSWQPYSQPLIKADS